MADKDLEPGQSLDTTGGSGAGQGNLDTGGDYSNADFFRDLMADGILDGKEPKTQERGATPPAQSADKTGTEAGAEPQQDKDKEPQQPPKLEKDGEQPPAAGAPAQVPPTGEAEQLTPEEAARREAQSWKDKAYAAEQEKEKLLEQHNARQQSDLAAQIESAHLQTTSPQRNLCNQLYQQWQAASEARDDEAANIYASQWNQAKQVLDFMDWQYGQTVEQRKQVAQKAAQDNHLRVVDRQLKEDFDTSVAELVKFKADLNPFDPFSLNKAISLLQKDRQKSEREKVLAEAQKYRDEARTRWGATDPGSQPDRVTSASGARGDGKVDYSGMSVEAILEDALSGMK
jgi:hypothetical protein